VLSPHFPEPSVVGRPRKHGFRAILNAILYVLRGGIVWRMLPKDCKRVADPIFRCGSFGGLIGRLLGIPPVKAAVFTVLAGRP